MSTNPDWLRLDEGEDVVWTGHPRTRSILRTVGRVAVPVVVVAVAIAALLTTDQVTVPQQPLFAILGLAVLYALARIGWAYVRIRNVDYVLTTTNLYKKTGVFSETVTRVGIDRIQSTQLTKDITGNLFDYGSIDVSTAGSSGTELRITDLDDPGTFQDALRERIRVVGAGSGGAAALDAETSQRVVEEARQLRETAERLVEVAGR